jgi:hypothetical protein
MAEEIIGVKVQVDASDVGKSVGSLKQQLREAQNEVNTLSEKFGATSKEAINAAKKAAQLKDAIGDAKALTDAFNPDQKFKALSSSLAGAAGGFAALQGAVGLFGNKAEAVEKTLLKVQSALALSQGLEAVGNSIDSFKVLGSVVKDSVSKAFGTLRSAIISTGIGALVVGVGLLIANFETVKKVVLNFIPGLGKVADYIGNLVNKITDFIGVTSESGRATAKLIADNEKAIASTERFLALNADKYDEYTQRKIKANLEFKKNENEFQNDQKLSEDEKNAYIKQAREKANREIAKSDEDRNKVARDASKKLADEQKAINDKLEADRKARKEQQYNDFVQFVNDLKASTDAEVELQEFLISEQKRKEQELFDWRVELAQQKYDASEEEFAFLQALNKRTLDEEQKVLDAKVAIQMAEIDLVFQLAGVLKQVAGKNKAIQAAAIIAENAAGIGRIIINTQVANAKAVAASPVTLGQPWVTINTISGALGVASSLLATRKALSELGGGSPGSTPSIGGRGGASAPLAPQEPTAQLTQLNQQSINQMGSATGRAYVVESDITNQQEKIIRINRAARLG